MEKKKLDFLPALILLFPKSVGNIPEITYISDSKFLIGRSSEASLKIHNLSVSRKHCTLEKVIPLKWTITAHNLVFVNGCPLTINEPTPLLCGDKIKLTEIVIFEFKCSLDKNKQCYHELKTNEAIQSFSDQNNMKKFESASTSTDSESSIKKSITNDISIETLLKRCIHETDLDTFNVPATNSQSSVNEFENSSFPPNINDSETIIQEYINHLQNQTFVQNIKNNNIWSQLQIELKYRINCLKYLENISKKNLKNNNILNETVEKLSYILEEKYAMLNHNMNDINNTDNENRKRQIIINLDFLLLEKMKSVSLKLQKSSDFVLNNDQCTCFKNIDKGSKVSCVCSLKANNENIFSIGCNYGKSDILTDELKINRQEAKIQFLEMKLKEKTKLEIELEAAREENEVLENKIAELKRTVANMEVMELEYKYLQEATKYKEDDKRSKDALERTITNLSNENTILKEQNEKLTSNSTALENEIICLTGKCIDLEKKIEAKNMDETKVLSTCSSRNSTDNYCCDMVREVKSSLLELIEREFNCSICGEMFVDATVTNCNHVFCGYCLKEWKKKKKQCPFCRANITKECKAVVIDEYITNLYKFISEKMYNERILLINERKITYTPPVKRARTTRMRPESIVPGVFRNYVDTATSGRRRSPTIRPQIT